LTERLKELMKTDGAASIREKEKTRPVKILIDPYGER
jgi:hypothetical protein